MKKSTRLSVLKRDDFRCQDCGQPLAGKYNPNLPSAEVHHITPRSEGGSDEPDNLVTLCDICHNLRHTSGEAESPGFHILDAEIDLLEDDPGLKERFSYHVIEGVQEHLDQLSAQLEKLEIHRPEMAYRVRDRIHIQLSSQHRRLVNAAQDRWGDEFAIDATHQPGGESEYLAVHELGTQNSHTAHREALSIQGQEMEAVQQYLVSDEVVKETPVETASVNDS